MIFSLCFAPLVVTALKFRLLSQSFGRRLWIRVGYKQIQDQIGRCRSHGSRSESKYGRMSKNDEVVIYR